jgi:hypothetical protein
MSPGEGGRFWDLDATVPLGLTLLAVLFPMSPWLALLLWLAELACVCHLVSRLVRNAAWRGSLYTIAAIAVAAAWWFTQGKKLGAKPPATSPAPSSPTATATLRPTGPTVTTSRTPHRTSPTLTSAPSPAAPTIAPRPTEPPVVSHDFMGNRYLGESAASKTAGPEVAIYWKMVEMANWKGIYTEQWCHWDRLRRMAETAMRDYDDWITPQVYAGLAYLGQGQRGQGEEHLAAAEARIGKDPRYAALLPIIGRRIHPTPLPTPADKDEREQRRLSDAINSEAWIASSKPYASYMGEPCPDKP